MSEPRTEAGRSLLAAIKAHDFLEAESAIAAIEDEARLLGYQKGIAFAPPLDVDAFLASLPGIRRVGDVTFGELMVPLSAIRAAFATPPGDET